MNIYFVLFYLVAVGLFGFSFILTFLKLSFLPKCLYLHQIKLLIQDILQIKHGYNISYI